MNASEKRRYGRGEPEDVSRCVCELIDEAFMGKQCSESRGHGPGGLYCEKHNPYRVDRDLDAHITPDMPVVYVAGPYNANGACAVLANIRSGINLCVKLSQHGIAPVCPWLDFAYCLHADVPESVLREISMALLRKADAVVVNKWRPGWEQSKGTAAEIAEATRLGIPVLYGMDEFLAWNAARREKTA